jgi:NADH-quinone oxidoreductase subunit C
MPDEVNKGGNSGGDASNDGPPATGNESTQPDATQAQPGDAAAAPAAATPAAEKPAAKTEKAAPAPPPLPPGGVTDLLKQALPDLAFEAHQGISDVIVEISRDDVPNVMPVAKDDPNLDFKFLRCLFGVDLEDDGMDVVYQLGSFTHHHDIVIKARLPKDDPRVASVAAIWNAANWHERETRDMFGIQFDGHDHLIPLLLPEDMTDHFPLRKSNALAEIQEWQGELINDEDEAAAPPEETES